MPVNSIDQDIQSLLFRAADYRLLAAGVSDSEALIRESGLTAGGFAQVITLMEISGKIRNLGAGQWVIRK